jgi:hypothetical protein
MNHASEHRLAELKQQIERGEYEVDPQAVADAIVERLRGLAAASSHPDEPQKECSYPDSSPSASVNTTLAGPGRTRPTQVNRWLSGAAAVLGGMQTQSP